MEKIGETPGSLSAQWSSTKIGLEHLQEEIESLTTQLSDLEDALSKISKELRYRFF